MTDLRAKIVHQISTRLSFSKPSGRSSPVRSTWNADIELKKYIKSSSQIFRQLHGDAFTQARQFYRSPQRDSRSPTSRLEVQSRATSPNQTNQSSSAERLNSLQSLISSVSNTSKDKRRVSSHIREGKQKYRRMKELLDFTTDDSALQFKE
jgi:hypothetical protein